MIHIPSRSGTLVACLLLFACDNLESAPSFAAAPECPGEPRTVVGRVYCDNKFTLWVNGREVATDPIAFTPHQAVAVSFEWDGLSSLTYAIQCEDYASPSGFEYIGTDRPQLGDGALIAELDDGLGTVTSPESWKVHTVTFGPTDESRSAGCSAQNLDACVVEDRGTPSGWTEPEFDDSDWLGATGYTARQAGWGRPPRFSDSEGCCGLTSPHDRSDLGCEASVPKQQCLDPRAEFSSSDATFLWAEDLERDNRVLFRHTAPLKVAKLDPSLIPRVEADELEDHLPHDVVRVRFELPKNMEPEQAAKDVKILTSENAKIQPLLATKRLHVIDTVANLRNVRDLIYAQQAAIKDDIRPVQFMIKHRRADYVADQVMIVLGLDPASRKTPQELQIEQQRMQLYAQMVKKNPNDVSKMLKPGGPEVHLAVNQRRNSILVNADPTTLAVIQRTIDQVDVPDDGGEVVSGTISLSRSIRRLRQARIR